MPCGCEHSGSGTCPQCEFEPFVKNNFFTGKLMSAADFFAEQAYHSEKMRHHNVRLHGSGITCGLGVHQHPSLECQKRYVVVEPGSALDCCGHEILIPDEEILDVANHPAVLDKTNDGQLHSLQVVACYRECSTEEVPVLYDDCGCDDTQCAANRILESFTLDVLVDPPLTGALGSGLAAVGAFATSDKHGATGWIKAGAAGKVAIVDPGEQSTLPSDAGKRVFILDVAHRSLVTVDLPSKARAIAMSSDGGHVFVVVDPVGTVNACHVLVFATADGVEVVPGSPRTITGTTAATQVSAATTADPGIPLVVLDGSAGKVLPWQADNVKVIKDGPSTAVTFVKGGSLSSAMTGAVLFMIDTTSKVWTLDLAAASPTATGVKGLPTTAVPTAIAPFVLGTTSMLAVASGAEKAVHIVDFANPPALVTVPVAHPPMLLGATGSAAAPWISVYEEDAGHDFVQAISLDATAPTATPLVTAARSAGDGPRNVVVVQADGQAAVVDPGRFADSDCSDLVCKQETCPDCDTPECVILATIPNYRAGWSLLDMAVATDDLALHVSRIDLRAGRRMLASTATLQAWLECLQLKGGVPGPKGDPGAPGAPGGPGSGITGVEVTTGDCGSLATATLQNGVLKLTIPRGCDGDPGGTGLVDVTIDTGDCDTPASATLVDGHLKIVIPGCCTPDLTRICGTNWEHAGAYTDPTGDLIVAFDGEIDPSDINRHTFIVETNDTAVVNDNLRLECWCQVVGEYRPLRLAEPCAIDKEDPTQPVTAMAFRPSPPFESGREYRVRVVGDLIRDKTGKRAVDANHLPPWLPARPTGDCVEGGTFHSWFTVKG